MVSASGLDLVTLCPDDMDFVFSDNNIVATENTTIAELIENVLEEASVELDSTSDTSGNNGGCALQPAYPW